MLMLMPFQTAGSGKQCLQHIPAIMWLISHILYIMWLISHIHN